MKYTNSLPLEANFLEGETESKQITQNGTRNGMCYDENASGDGALRLRVALCQTGWSSLCGLSEE